MSLLIPLQPRGFKKKNPERILLEQILGYIVKSSPREADPHVREEAALATHKLSELTDANLYDIIQRVGDREVHCEVSPFMHTLCDLRPFYIRPED